MNKIIIECEDMEQAIHVSVIFKNKDIVDFINKYANNEILNFETTIIETDFNTGEIVIKL